MKKRTKNQKEEQRHANAQAFSEGFQMGFTQGKKVGEADALRKLQNNNTDNANRPAPSLSDLPKLSSD
jgi:flagellar biosynthesis/type III secretory pathway protein FliH